MMTLAPTPLAELMARRQGSVDPSRFPAETFELFSIPAFDQGKPEIVAGAKIGSAKVPVKPGDVLLSRIVPHIRRAWVVPKANGHRQIASGEWIVFRGKQFAPSYLRHLLTSDVFHSQFMNTVAGVGGSLLRARPAFVGKIEIPLPPLSEQRRIADILDKADGVRRKRREVQGQLNQYSHAVFKELFGHPESNRFSWPMMRFADVCDSRLGKMIDAKRQTGRNKRPYMRNLNVGWGRIDLSEVFEMDFDAGDRKQFRLVDGDVLICEGGAGVGQTAIWRDQLPECYFQKSLHRVRPRPDLATSEYLATLMWVLMQGSSLLRSVSSATIPHLTGEKLKEVLIPLPPIEKQTLFSEIVRKSTEAHCTSADLARQADELFASLVQRAFRGEL